MVAFPKQHLSIWWNTFRDSIQNLYSCDQINPLEQNLFLNNLKAGLSGQQKEHLQIDLSEFEIETAISQMVKDKSPGPDGLSVEFYTQCWPIVKNGS